MSFDSEADPLQVEPVGTAKVTEQSVFGGSLSLVDSYPGGGVAAEFPEFSEGNEEPGVGLVASPGDKLLPEPSNAEFGFGADVRLRSVESSDDDNGDNIIQRGLAADPAQFKLQIDHGVPSCSVTGDAGRRLVKGELLEEGIWYRLACVRATGALKLTVSAVGEDELKEYEVKGSTGRVDFVDATPLAIGRKATGAGEIVIKQPDQFNGTLDSVWVGIDDER
ncbi:MAG: hypothetical protein QM611_06740 [Microbacterium sp.]|uniref:hypothetical protein n=1 Tax=Microbacterium sp. TaxID=51671 RepID=UPI0039E5EC64